MKKLLLLSLILTSAISRLNAQTCSNIVIDSFDDATDCLIQFAGTDPVNTVKSTECSSSNALSGARDLWAEQMSGGPGGTSGNIYLSTGQLFYEGASSFIAKTSITYDGSDGNTDPLAPNTSGPVLGDFTNKKIQFTSASTEAFGTGRFIKFTFIVWDGAGNVSQATLNITGPRATMTNVVYDLGLLSGTANLADVRAAQFIFETNQNGMDNAFDNLTAVCPDKQLPVKLETFVGNYSENSVNLNWTTSSEINADFFEIERSLNAIDFKKIGLVPVSGGKNTTTKYSFVDPDIKSKIAYYRLKMVDMDQTFAYSRIISIKSNESRANYIAYPTIFTNSITIDLPESGGLLSIVNLKGETKYQSSFKNNASRLTLNNLTKLEKGLYLLKVISNGQVSTTKIIKQ